jgi:glycosyltransferase involved in cell wall biosynthesis
MNILITSFSFPSPKDNIYDGKFILSEAMSYAANGANVRVVMPYYFGAQKIQKVYDKITVYRFQYLTPKSWETLKMPGVPMYARKSFSSIIQIPFLCLFFCLNIIKHAVWADIIHAQWTVTALLALPAKWFLGKKIVVTARGSDLRLLPNWVNRFIHKQVDAAIDCFGPQPWNQEYKQRFPAYYIKLPLLVHKDASGIMPEDMKQFGFYKSGEFNVLYVGRFDPIKLNDNKLPLFNLIRAGKILKQKNMKFHIFFIGSGNEHIKREILNLIDKYDLHGFVTLLGPKINVLDYVQFCNLGVGGIAFNGVSEEFTIMGKPQLLVKGIDNENTPWHHGINCIFVESDDQIDLTEKLIWAYEHRDELKNIGKRAKDDMSRYITDSKTGGRLYIRAFSNLIGDRTRTRMFC